jgi:cyclopropane fatty-acyl-phospholipid synthase-like methyltransferase
MSSEDGDFWDHRYRTEGAIWGEQPSPTAVRVAAHLPARARVLDIGFGYGRDLAFLAGRGCHVWGVEISREGYRLAEQRLLAQGNAVEQLYLGRFEKLSLPEASFDAILSHRMAHLLLTAEAVADFTDRLHRLLQPGGILAIGARNLEDLDPAKMVQAGEQVYEYRCRPDHRIRYWDDESFRKRFDNLFTIDELEHAREEESRANPVPCHLTILIARKKCRPCAG